MTQTFSLLGFVAHLKVLERDMHRVDHAIVARACELICAEAKRVIGTYDYGWPQLAPATLAHKIANTPLLETGEMRDSIEWNAEGNKGYVGSNSDIAVYQELGTSRIPPRSFLAMAAQRMEPQIHKMAARAVVALIAGRGLFSPEMRELLHLLRHIYHEGKELVEGLTEDNDSERHKR